MKGHLIPMPIFSRTLKTLLFVLLALSLSLTMVACNRSASEETVAEQPAEDASASVDEAEEAAAEEEAEPPAEVVEPTEAPEPTEVPTEPALSAEPQRIEFQADDGKNLVGYYFPAAVNPAPTVILMHWAGGDNRDWVAIAPWLQNRPDDLAAFPDWAAPIGADCPEQVTGEWLDPSWFSPMPAEASFGVFMFDFRDFCESEKGMVNREEWALDAKAAFDTAAELPGVDAHQLSAIGASIGADGAPDGSLLHNQASSTSLGAFSLSPGGYFDMPYAEVVAELDAMEPAVANWCVTSVGDTYSLDACNSASGEHYQMFTYDDDAHGMMLVTPDRDPDPIVLIQDFLEEIYGVELN
jgi:hypothetical protein